MDKKTLTETDIRTQFITPALLGTNGDKWNLMSQIREETFFTKGRVIVLDRGEIILQQVKDVANKYEAVLSNECLKELRSIGRDGFDQLSVVHPVGKFLLFRRRSRHIG